MTEAEARKKLCPMMLARMERQTCVEAAARAWYNATEADNPTATRWDDEWPADTLWLREEYRARARRFLAAMPSRSDVLAEAIERLRALVHEFDTDDVGGLVEGQIDAARNWLTKHGVAIDGGEHG